MLLKARAMWGPWAADSLSYLFLMQALQKPSAHTEELGAEIHAEHQKSIQKPHAWSQAAREATCPYPLRSVLRAAFCLPF